MDRRVRLLGLALCALFLLLFAQISYVQVFASGRIAANAANAFRQYVAEYHVDRGPILARDGTTQLAYSRKTKGTLQYQRRYPSGDLYAGITGFYSIVYGKSELESSMNSYLTGDAPELAAQTFSDLILGRPKKGGAVVTTIDARLQQVASQALGSEPGAVVAMDPRTGDILSMVSNPSFDPNLLSSGTTTQIKRNWDKLNSDPNTPLLWRSNDELFPPGSTFKMITASAALEDGYTTSSTFPNPRELNLPLTNGTLQNFGGEWCNGGASQISLIQAFTVSCNVTFGEIGLKLGPEKLQAQAEAYGFCPTDPPTQTTCLSPTVPFTIPFQTGRFPEPSYFQGNDPLVAISAIGQDNVLANPLQMALVASAIANGGVEMQPRLVLDVRDPSGRVVKTFPPQQYGTPISPDTARAMTQMMVSVVNSGTGTAAQIPGVTVAGKTGTAQHGTGNPHAWFVSFAPAENPRIVVAVIVLDGGSLGSEATGGQVAAPIAKQVIEAALQG
jgi:peptidoglycan glycosyltransferase